MEPVIQARGLVKHYGDVKALDGLDLSVDQGTILGVLGPNGAGKTTAVNILTTLLEPDAGTATVAGVDVAKNPAEVRKHIGLSGQSVAIDEHLTGFENLDMIGRLYGLGKAPSKARSRELLDQFDLADAADRPVKTYSGGMRRRLDLAGALVAESPILFLDEPTTGLDPRSRNELWNVIRDLVGRGTTLLLTTQYLEEADRLADRVLVIDHGREIALGSPHDLKTMIGGDRIAVTVSERESMPVAHEILERVAIGEIFEDERARFLLAPIEGGAHTLRAALRAMDDAEIEVDDVGIRRPTLDDVFLALTGHHAEEDAPDGPIAEEVPA